MDWWCRLPHSRRWDRPSEAEWSSQLHRPWRSWAPSRSSGPRFEPRTGFCPGRRRSRRGRSSRIDFRRRIGWRSTPLSCPGSVTQRRSTCDVIRSWITVTSSQMASLWPFECIELATRRFVEIWRLKTNDHTMKIPDLLVSNGESKEKHLWIVLR